MTRPDPFRSPPAGVLLALLCTLLSAGVSPAASPAEGEYATEVLSEGAGWMVASVEDLKRSAPPTEVYIVVGEQGINASPMPAGEKGKLLRHAASTSSSHLTGAARREPVFIVNKEIVDSYWKNGLVPKRYEAHAGGCENQLYSFAESFSPSFPLSHTLPVGQGIASGEINIAVTLNPQLNLRLEIEVLKTEIIGGFCVGSSARLHFFEVDAALDLVDGHLGMTLTAEIPWSRTYEREIAHPTVWRQVIPVAGLPVIVNFKLPMKIGVEIDTGVVGSTTVGVDWNGSFGLDYRCEIGGCTGSNSRSFHFQPSATPPTASIGVDLKAKPFFDARVRANIYSDRIVYGEVGLRAGIQNRLWGYLGNECGDGDLDQVNETVTGAIFDSYFDLQLPYAYGGILGSGEQFEDLYKRSIYFHDFLHPIANNAVAPVLTGPASTDQHVPTSYDLWMRPCYPLAEDPVVGLATTLPDYQNTAEYDLAAGQAQNLIYTFQEAGSPFLKAVNVEDSIHRNIGSYASQMVTVTGEPGGGGDGGSGPCESPCPPAVIHGFDLTPHADYPNDLRRARFKVLWKLPWDLDEVYYQGVEYVLSIERTYFDRNGNPISALTDRSTQDPAPVSRLDNMAVHGATLWWLPEWNQPIQKTCWDIDTDYTHQITPDDLSVSFCVEHEGLPIVLAATVVEGTNDVLLEWNDDNHDENDNSFDLYRSDDGGETFSSLVVSGLTGLQYTDVGLDSGNYVYAIDSYDVRYLSNPVAIGGPLPIYFYDPRFFFDEEGGPRMTVRITDDNPHSQDLHRHEISVSGGPWVETGYDLLLSIDSNAVLDPYVGSHQVQFRTSRWLQGSQDSPWYYSQFYSILIRDWDLTASRGGPADQDVPAGMIRLTWNEQPDVGTYTVERAHEATGAVTTLSISTPPPFLDGAFADGDRYWYKIRAFDEPWSAEDLGQAFTHDLPGIPSYVHATDDLLDHIRLDWEPLENVTGYELFRRESYTSEPAAIDLIATVPGSSTVQHVDTEAPIDVPVHYWVRGFNSEGYGGYAHTTGFRPTVIQNGLPDLTVRNVTMGMVNVLCKKAPCPARNVGGTYLLANDGNIEVIGVTVRVWLSLDAVVDSSDTLAGEVFAASLVLAAGGTFGYGGTWEVPSEFVGHAMYVLVQVDPNGTVLESEEGNNVGMYVIPEVH